MLVLIENIKIEYPIIFLDFDGVLNDHTPHANGYNGIMPDQVKELNKILKATNAQLVISSAWRYLVHGGHMTIKGIEVLLVTFGVNCLNNVIGITDLDALDKTRGDLITEWMYNYGQERNYIVVDDMDAASSIQISKSGHPFVQTDGNLGLTSNNTASIIKFLKGMEYARS